MHPSLPQVLLAAAAGALLGAQTGFVIGRRGGRPLVRTVGLVLAGYAPGSSVPDVDRYLLPMVALIVVISLLPLALELLRSRKTAKTSQ